MLRLAVLIALVLLLSGASAQRGVRSVSTGSYNSDDEILPPFVARPFDKTYFTWSLVDETAFATADGRTGTFLVGNFNFTEDKWVAIGLRSEKKMRGPIVLCKTRGGVNETNEKPFCVDMWGNTKPDYSWKYAESSITTVVSSSSASGKYSIVFATLVRDSATNQSIIEWNADHRVIFATGKWYDGREQPKQHDAEDVYAALINFNTGTVTKMTSDLHRIVIYTAIGWAVFVMIVFKIVRMTGRRVSHKLRRMVGIFMLLTFMALGGGYMFANYRDYKITVTRKAAARAIGDGAAWCFSCLLLPVGRRIVFSDLLTVSHERAIKYHMAVALFLILFTAIHGFTMLSIYGSSRVLRWKDKDEVSKLPGFFAFLLMIPIIVIALLRNRVIHFKIFRVSHYLYLPLFFLACCHYPKLTIGLAPGGGLLLLSFLYKRLVNPLDESETIERLMYDEVSQTVILDILKADYILPGQYYYIGIPEISGFDMHPFAVARATVRERTRVLRFIIRNTGSLRHQRRKVMAAREADAKVPTVEKAEVKPTWTSKLFDMAKEGRLPKSYRLDGPYGILQVSPRNYQNIVMIAGGVGVSPHICLLQSMALQLKPVVGEMEQKQCITLIWVLPDRALFNLFWRDLQAFGNQIQSMDGKLVRIKVFITHSDTGGVPEVGGPSLPAAYKRNTTVDVLEGSRPKFESELAEFGKLSHQTFPADDSKGAMSSGNLAKVSNLRVAALFLSGPPSMMDAAQKAADETTLYQYHIHREAYQI